jgi:hypothetical protein
MEDGAGAVAAGPPRSSLGVKEGRLTRCLVVERKGRSHRERKSSRATLSAYESGGRGLPGLRFVLTGLYVFFSRTRARDDAYGGGRLEQEGKRRPRQTTRELAEVI